MRHLSHTGSLAVIAAVMTSTMPTVAIAQSPLFTFRIPAGSLDDALRRYARITGRQILYHGDVVRGRRVARIDGQYSADAALALILAGSGLSTQQPSPGVFVVQSIRTADPSIIDSSAESDDAQQRDIIVTGSNIRGAAGQTAPVRTLTRSDLERSGKATVADAIAALPQNFGGTGNPIASLTGADRATLNNSVAPSANLRGVGSDATLTLFNSRRVAGSGGRGDFTDLSAVPSLAIDRVEILTDGASAIYGSDAVGGVVNLILRDRLKGVEMRLRGAAATDGSFRNALGGLAAGQSWAGGGVFLAYEFEHRDSLSAADRRYAATGDLRPFGGSDRRSYLSVPGTILAFSPTARAYVPALAIPSLSAGAQLTAAQIVPGSNLSNPLAGTDLSPGFDRHAVYVHIDQSLTSSLDVFAEGRYARRTFGYAGPASATVLQVTAANPSFIPIGGAPFSLIGYSFANELGATRTKGGVSALSATAGLSYRFGRDWTIDAYGSFSRERSGDRTYNLLNPTSLNEALGTTLDNPLTPFSTATSGFFNPYGSGSSNTATVLGFIGNAYADLNRRSSIAQGAVKASGSLFALPGGTVKLAIGGDVRRETFARGGELFYSGIVPVAATANGGNRNVKAVFAELDIPIVGQANASSGLRRLVVSAAVRHEDYNDFGTTTNPKIGLAWTPAEGVTLRGSWGTSFRAPALPEINDRLSVGPTQLPTGTGAFAPVIFITGGNPDLGPERARSFTFGTILEPSAISGLRLEANLFSIRFRDQIGQPALQDILRALTNPALAPYIQTISPATSAGDLARVNALLATPGSIGSAGLPPTAFQAIIDGRFVNTSSLTVSGLDGDVRLRRPLGGGQVDLGFGATWLFRYATRLTPLAATQDRLDTTGNPAAIRFRSSVNWTRGILSTTVTGNYVNGYSDTLNTPNRSVSSFFTIDANIGIVPIRGILRGFRLAVSADNLLDAEPPFVNQTTGFGFDAANANPFGRSLALEIAYKF